MRPVLAMLCFVAPLIVIQACGRDADRPDYSVSPDDPLPREDDSGRIRSMGVNQCPTAGGHAVFVLAGSIINFSLIGSDPDGDPIQFIVTAPPTHGVLVVNTSTGAASYRPNTGYCGPDGFRYVVSDAICTSTEGAAVIDVICNRCPVASDLGVDVDQDSQVNFQLPASDADGHPLQYLLTQPPAHGTVVVATATGAAVYTPNAGYTGPDSFKFKARDAECESNEATVTINVEPVDVDGDGVPDGQDDCPDSDFRPTIYIGDCDTGVANEIDGGTVNAAGCTLADLVRQQLAEAAAGASNQGQLVSNISKSLKNMARMGLIGVDQHGAIMQCVSQTDE